MPARLPSLPPRLPEYCEGAIAEACCTDLVELDYKHKVISPTKCAVVLEPEPEPEPEPAPVKKHPWLKHPW